MMAETTIEDTRWERAGLTALAEVAGKALEAVLGLNRPHEISLLGCDDARIAALNTSFRDKAMPTNVLSWPSAERAPGTPGTVPEPPEETELGDIAIAFDTCAREAADQGKDFTDHVTHLLVHGMLHLLGYDHINEKDAALMEGLEVEILGKLGILDPYEE